MIKRLFTKSNVVRTIVIIGVIIIPLMYSFFYLSAFWDPYSKLDTLPVALVNNDKGATINSKERNLGEEFCKKLSDNNSFKFVVTNKDDAKKGTEGKDYYAIIEVPENFSTDIASATTTDKHTAEIIFSANEKKNYLSSQILSRAILEMEKTTRESVTKEIVDTLTNQINGLPTQMSELQDGFAKLSDGSDKLNNGGNDLKAGTSEFSEKFGQFSKGITTAKNGSDQVKVGTASLQSGINQLLDGTNQLLTSTQDVDKLTTGSQTLAVGAKQLNDGLIVYTSGVESLIANVKDTSAFLTTYVSQINPDILKDPYFAGFMQKMSNPENAKNIATLEAATAQLKDASSQITAGANTLASGTKDLPKLKSALAQLQAGLIKAKSGSSALVTGTQSLNSGLSTLNGATAQLNTATEKIKDGTATLSGGISDLNTGINTAKTKVDSSLKDSKDQLSALNGLSDFASKPVEFRSDTINPISNYGTYFSPYFMSLSLWVGALIIFFGIYLDADGRFAILSRNSTNKVARSFIYLLIGMAQAIILGIVIVAGLGLDVKHLGLYFISVCLVSLVFISIVQFCLVHLGDMGKFVSIALLILQLTSCGGTFPMETVPKFFNILFPFMPMTYSVALFKDTISGSITSDFWFNLVVLTGILIVSFAATVLLSLFKKAKRTEAIA